MQTAAHSTPFDTLTAAKHLQAAGVAELQAEAIVQVVSQGQGSLATKADITAVKTDITAVKADIEAVKTDITAVKTDIETVKNDITAVKAVIGTLATKEELKPLSTKAELKPLATKEELKPLATKAELEIGLAQLKYDMTIRFGVMLMAGLGVSITVMGVMTRLLLSP